MHQEILDWVLDEISELDQLLIEIAANRSMLSAKYEQLMSHRSQCSWKARAEYVDQHLATGK